MESKQSRLETIKRIIQERQVCSQEELLNLLAEAGHTVTQATLSRDLKRLGVSKSPAGRNGYVYILPVPHGPWESVPQDELTFLSRGFLSLAFSGNICVVHTLPGYASSVAEVLDRCRIKGLLGTVAGDNTIIAVLEQGLEADEFKGSLAQNLPFLKEKFK